MAEVAHLDSLTTLNMQEKWGVIVGCTRRAVVTGLPDETDFSVMYHVLDNAGVPQEGTYLDGDRTNHLILIDRNVNMLGKNSAEVILVVQKHR